MTRRLQLLAIFLLFGVSSLATAQQSPDPALLLPWSEVKAISDADAAIDTGELHIYWTGGIACRPAVAPEAMDLARTLPKRYVACGCIVYDGELRTAQRAYARAFNQRILDHLASRQ
jgi:hypothetical protein